MNLAIEKLEKEIAELEGQSEHFKFCESSGDESWRLTMKGCRKKADERLAEKRALKACVEALEGVKSRIEENELSCLCCGVWIEAGRDHRADCDLVGALALVNRAM